MTNSPDTTPNKSLLWYESIALRLPLLFILTLLIIATIAATSVSVIVNNSTSNLALTNFSAIAQNESEQINRLLTREIDYLDDISQDPRLISQVERLNRMMGEMEASDMTALDAEWQASFQAKEETLTSNFVRSVMFSPASDLLRELVVASISGQNGLLLVNLDGGVVGGSYFPPRFDYSQSDWYRALAAGAPLYVNGRTIDKYAPAVDITEIALPLTNDDGEVIGYLRGVFDFANIKEIIQQGRFNITGRSVLIDNQGQIVYTVSQNNSLAPYRLPAPRDLNEQEALEFNGEDGVLYLNKAEEVVSVHPAVNDINWFVAAIQPKTDALAPVYDALWPSLLLSALVAMISVAALYMLYVRPLTQDLRTVQSKAEALQRNIYSEPVQLKRKDELGELAATYNQMARDLRQQIETREQIIAERTRDLRKRANQLEASMQIGRAANSSLELDRLLRDTVNLIRDRSNYYHASVFLVDESGQNVVVRESTGEVGELLKAKPHTLAIGSKSIVGQATATRKHFLARDVGGEDSYFDNPLLPETRSEVALPLISQGQLLGALDVQSRKVDAFSLSDLNVLQQMADHVAAAVYNARLFAAVQLRNQRQRQVIQLWQEIGTMRRPEEILQTTAECLVSDFGYMGAYLGKVIGNDFVVQATAVSPGYEPVPFGTHRNTLTGSLRDVLHSQETRLVKHDLPNDPLLYELNVPHMRVEVIAPVVTSADEQTVSHLLVVYENAVHKLDVNDEILLSLLSEALSASLANADLLNTKDRNLLELDRLYRKTSGAFEQGQQTEGVYTPPVHSTAVDSTSISHNLVSSHRVPLLLRDQVIGEIVVEGDPHGWTSEMENLTTAVAQETAYALENSELFAQTQRRLGEQETLFELTNQLTRTFDIDEIYRYATRAFVEELGARGCVLGSWEQISKSVILRSEYIHPTAENGRGGHYTSQETLPVEEYPHTELVLTGRALRQFTAVQSDLTPAEQAFMANRNAHHLLTIPLVAGEVVLGLVAIYRTANQPVFTERDVRFAEAMAVQTAVTLQNAMLATRAREQVNQLNTLNRISRTLSAAQAMHDMYETIRQELLTIVNATGVSISLVTADGQHVRWSYLYEHDAEVDLSSIPPMPLNTGLTGHVLTTREPLLLNTRTNLDQFRELTGSISVGAETSAWLGVPVIYAGALLGALVVENEADASAFDAPEVELMTTVAANLAVAINNVRQFQELQNSRAKAEMLYEAGQRLSRAEDSPQVLATLGELPLLANTAVIVAYVFEQPWNAQHKPDQLTVHAHWLAPGQTLPPIAVSSEINDWQNAPLLRYADRTKPLIITDIQAAPDFVPPDLVRALAPQIASIALFPLTVGRGCVGLLTILGTEPRAWPADHLQQLTSLIGQAAVTMQNRRLLDRTQTALEIQRQQSVQLQTAAEVAAVSSSFREVDELLQAAADLIKERFGLYYVGMFFPDPEREFAVLRAGTGEEGQRQIALGHKLPLNNKSLVGSTVMDGQPRIRQDVTQAGDWFANPHLPETKSEIALPLIVRKRTIGVLSVQSRRAYAFSPELVRVLQTMSDQLAIAIDNAGLFERLQTNLEKTADLYEAARQLGTAVDEYQVFAVLVSFTQRTNLFSAAYVLAHDANSADQITLQAHTYISPQANQPPAFTTAQDDLLPLLTTAESHNVQMILRPSAHERLPETFRQFLVTEQVEACALIPIYAGETWLATLILARQSPRLPEPDELQPFQTLCNQAAVALANQRLLQETNALYQLGRSLSAAITREDMARATAGEISAYTGIAQVRVVFYNRTQSFEGLSIEFVSADNLRNPFEQLQVGTDALYDELTATREPVWLTESDSEQQVVERYLRPFGVRSALCIPAFSQHQMLLGVVLLDSFSPSTPFTQASINFAQVATDQFTTSVENIIFFDEALQRAQQLITLNQIGSRISGTLDSNELAHLVYQEISGLVACDVFYLAEYDGLSRTYRSLLLQPFEEVAEESEVDIRTHGRLTNDSPLLNALESGETLVLPQAEALSTTITHLYRPTAVATEELSIPASTIFLPMHQSRQPTAFMVVQAYKSFAYTAEEVNLLRAISNQAVLALATARLLAETQENVAELRTLFNVTQSAATSVDADERIANMVNTLHNSLGEAKVELYLLDERYNELEVTQSRGFMAASPGFRLPAEGSLIGQVISRKSPRLITDWTQEPGFDASNSTRSQMIVPLTIGQRIVGVLNAESSNIDQFDDRDLRLLQTLSVSLAATIESGRLFRDIQTANEQLRELDKMKTQFLANMSHELRTPLNSIIGFSRLILKGIDGPITDMQEEDLTSIHNSGQHLLNLINDVLDLAKIDAGKMALVFDDVDLAELADSVQSTARGLVRDDNVDLRWSVAPNLPHIEADPVRLRQILLNLLSNAAKFTEQGYISLDVHPQGENHIQISVRDTGIGIAEKDFDRLFTAFEQVDANPSRAVGGTGLGLPIVKELVQLHRGRIWFESKIGHGSTFFIELPIRQPADVVDPVPSAVEDSVANMAEDPPLAAVTNGLARQHTGIRDTAVSTRNTLLLVDDEPGILTLYQRYLYEQSFELISVRNGQSALLVLEEQASTLAGIIMDVFMPELTGWDVLEIIRQNPAYNEIPVVLCSIEDNQEKAQAFGAQAMLPKPIIADDLLQALRQVGILPSL